MDKITKIPVNVLPCTNRKISTWYWLMIISFIVDGIIYRALPKEAFSIILIMVLLFPCIVFCCIFAKACRVLDHKISKMVYASLIILCISLLIAFLMGGYSTITSLVLLLAGGLMYMTLWAGIGLRMKKYFEGEVGFLGESIVKYNIYFAIFLLLLIASALIYIFEYSYVLSLIILLLLIGCVIYILFYFYQGILSRMHRILSGGLYMAEMDSDTWSLFKQKDLSLSYINGNLYFIPENKSEKKDKVKDQKRQFKIRDKLNKRFKFSDKISKKPYWVFSIIAIILLIGSGIGYSIYKVKRASEIKAARNEYDVFYYSYFSSAPDIDYKNSNYVVEGKIDGKKDDKLVVFPVEESRISNHDMGQKDNMYSHLVVKSESGELPDLILKPEMLELDYFVYGENDESVVGISLTNNFFEKGKDSETALVLQSGGDEWFINQAAYFILNNGKWEQVIPIGEKSLIELKELYKKEYEKNVNRYSVKDNFRVVTYTGDNDAKTFEVALFALGKQDYEEIGDDGETSVRGRYNFSVIKTTDNIVDEFYAVGEIKKISSMPSKEEDGSVYLCVHYASTPDSNSPKVEVYKAETYSHGCEWSLVGIGTPDDSDPTQLNINYSIDEY